MADLMATDPTADRTQRRRKRLERELRVLHAMDGHLSTKEITLAVVTIPALAVLCLVVAVKLHMASASSVLAIAGAVACGAAIWFIGRRWLVVAVLIVLGLLLILFEDVPDVGDLGGSKGKEKRRIKLQRAIEKRETLLQKLNEAQS